MSSSIPLHPELYIGTENVQQSLSVPDYDLQTALMEALCRMATPAQRKEMADRWFSMEHVATAFVKIRDSEFETVKRHNLSKCM